MVQEKSMISFIIPVYNSEKTIGQCLESVLSQKGEKEVIVVYTPSKDRTLEIIKKFKGIEIIVCKKTGPAAARNLGLERAKGEYIACVDSDCVLPERWAEKAVNLLKDKKLAGVGGPGISKEKSLVSRALDALLFGVHKNVKKKYVLSLATMDVMYRRSAIEGLRFDESLITGEDPEFNFRLGKRGYKLLFSRELWVYHYHPATLGGLLKKWYNYGKQYPLPFFRHKKMSAGFFARVFYFPLLLIWVLLSFFNQVFLFVLFVQVFLLFLMYFYIGIKTCSGRVLLVFPFVHTLKQLAQVFGIWVGVVKRLKKKSV
ncbi:MAG: hypothetical protein DRP18_04975 [Candidatus Aenigmatarchaeota archaeon]|nr:MAG: hypothetical protein DRP18_04975 [Candidatus Aenigmarchaeota archaeon]